MTTIHITEIGNAHAPDVVGLILPIQTEEFNIPITLADQPDLLTIDAFYRGAGGNFWGAFDDQRLVGTIGMIHFQPGAAAIRKMFVRKEYRGQERGVAIALLNQLLAYGLNIGVKDVYLGTVQVLQAAHRFYERNGFQRVAKQQLPQAFPLMPADDVFYHLHLGNTNTKAE